jgi:FAD/FMN-containing dehydrogenase
MHHLIIGKMSRTETVNPAAATMIVEAGVTLGRAQAAAHAERMMFALDIGSRDSCTIGGTLVTNAGGNPVLKYGMARDLVLGLEVVLTDGTILTSFPTEVGGFKPDFWKVKARWGLSLVD